MSKNLATTTVATAPSPATSGTSLTVATGTGSRLYDGMAVLHPAGAVPTAANAEVVSITVSGDVVTLTRAQESSTARTVVVGDILTQGITAAMWDALVASNAGKAAASHVHSAADITSGTLPLARGGTGGTDAATARTSLGLGTAATMTPATIAADPALTATYAPRVSTLVQATVLNLLPYPVMSSPPTVGAAATASAIASPQYRPATVRQGDTGYDLTVNTWDFLYTVGGDLARVGATLPDYNYLKSRAITDAATGAHGDLKVEFDHWGTTLEIMWKGQAGKYLLWVDGQLVSATPGSGVPDGNTYFLPITFASRGKRRIAFQSTIPSFGGVVIGPTDQISKPGRHRPNVVILGDSFSEGTGASHVFNSWCYYLGELLGWDVQPSGVGSTGYLAPGTGGRVKFRDRVAHDVIALAPDVVVVAGGINDFATYSAAAIGAEVTTLLATIKAGLPLAPIFVVSPFINKGAEGQSPSFWDMCAAVKAAATAAGAYYVDLINPPLTGPAVSGTLAAQANAAATSVSSTVLTPLHATVEIGTGATRERRRVEARSGTGPYALTVAALGFTHPAGETVVQVGQSLWTGTGRVGATTGKGNCDLWVSSDTTHPTDEGHRGIAEAVAGGVLAAFRPAIAL